MDYDSPEVMKDFPGLYAAEKRKANDSDYNDDNEKATKKEMIIGKRKEKKDKKDRDKGYAALEGESSDEASPCKSKKSKAFKFSKSKEKELPKDRAECSSKKKKTKHQKSSKGFGNRFIADGTTQDLAEALPIFGASLESACQRGKCHDGIYIPLPVRECVDYIEANGLAYENVYKVSGPKNKVQLIRKMYNNRQLVKLTDYDVPTATSVLKAFLRDLPEPILTNELIVRFEEAGAIFNYHTRAKHLSSLMNSLPECNRRVLIYLISHLHNVTQNEEVNKMSEQNLAQALNHVFRISSRLLLALIMYKVLFFPEYKIIKYSPPLEAGAPYPEDPNLIIIELSKLESTLSLIHWEMQQGFCSDARQEQLWEAQRMETELKRKLKKEFSLPLQALVSEETDGHTMDSHAAGGEGEGDGEGEEEERGKVENEISLDPFPLQRLQEQVQHDVVDIGRQNESIQEAIPMQQTAAGSMDVEQDEDSDVESDENNVSVSTDGRRNRQDADESPNQPIVNRSYSGHSDVSGPLYVKTPADQAYGNLSLSAIENPSPEIHLAEESAQKRSYCRYPVIVSGPGCQAMLHSPVLRESEFQHQAVAGCSHDMPGSAALKPAQHEQSAETSDSEYTQENEDPMQEADFSTESEYEYIGSKSIPEKTKSIISKKEDSEIEFTSDEEDHYMDNCVAYDTKLYALQAKNDMLSKLILSLSKSVQQEKDEIDEYKKKLDALSEVKKKKPRKFPRKLDEVRSLLFRENHMLEIKKVQLVRQLMEHREQCVELKAMMRIAQ